MKNYLLIFLLFNIAKKSTAQRHLFPSNQLPNITTRIVGYSDTIINGAHQTTTSVGTGFFYGFTIDSTNILTLVTNKHVVEKSKNGILTFKIVDSTYRLGKIIKSDTIHISEFNEKWIYHPTEDIAILPLDSLQDYFSKKYKTPISYAWFDKSIIPSIKDSIQISSVERVLMVGYPKSLWDSTNNLPAIRQGLTATPFFSDFNGQRRFLIDIPTFPGSSGSPVVLYSFDPYWTDTHTLMNEFRTYLLGIAVESYTYNADGKILSNTPNPSIVDSIENKYRPQLNLPLNIAVVIKSDRLFDFSPLLKNYLLKRQKK